MLIALFIAGFWRLSRCSVFIDAIPNKVAWVVSPICIGVMIYMIMEMASP